MLTRLDADVGNGGTHGKNVSSGQLKSDSTSQNILYSLYV